MKIIKNIEELLALIAQEVLMVTLLVVVPRSSTIIVQMFIFNACYYRVGENPYEALSNEPSLNCKPTRNLIFVSWDYNSSQPSHPGLRGLGLH